MHPILPTIAFSLLCFLTSCTPAPATVETETETETALAPPVESVAPVFHASHEPSKAEAPYSDVVQVDNLYFLAGQIGKDHTTGKLAAGGIQAETRQCLENIKAVLAQHDLEMTDVVKALVVLDDINDFAAFNEVYKTYLPQKPARTTFAAEALAAGAKIEIEVIAVSSN
jgi:2-iminobutanoate/2-iminopropanoate deaminase